MSVLTWRGGRGWSSIRNCLRVPCLASDRNKGMRTVMALVDAIIAIAPVAFIAIVALPVAGIGICLAHVAEDADFDPFLGIVLAHEHMWRCCGLCQWRHGSAISMPDEDMGVLVVWRIATFGGFSFVSWPGSPAKPIPMLASSAETVAAEAYVILSIVATSTVVVKLVLYVVFTTSLARYVRLVVQNRGA